MKAIIGLSGGVDSTYALLQAKNMGYDVLPVIFLNGWETDIAANNIKLVCDYLNIKPKFYRCDQNEYHAIQRAFLLASTPDSECPTDIAIKKTLLNAMDEHQADVIITGSNKETEGRMPEEWSMVDGLYVKDVCRRFGVTLKTFPNLSLFDVIRYKRHTFNILEPRNQNQLYNPAEAKNLMKSLFGWQDYGGKHQENVYTRFICGLRFYKFGIDPRIIEFHAKVKAGVMTYDEMMNEMQKPIVPLNRFEQDWELVEQRLNVKRDEIMALPIKSFRDYRTYRYHTAVVLTKKILNVFEKRT